MPATARRAPVIITAADTSPSRIRCGRPKKIRSTSQNRNSCTIAVAAPQSPISTQALEAPSEKASGIARLTITPPKETAAAGLPSRIRAISRLGVRKAYSALATARISRATPAWASITGKPLAQASSSGDWNENGITSVLSVLGAACIFDARPARLCGVVGSPLPDALSEDENAGHRRDLRRPGAADGHGPATAGVVRGPRDAAGRAEVRQRRAQGLVRALLDRRLLRHPQLLHARLAELDDLCGLRRRPRQAGAAQ